MICSDVRKVVLLLHGGGPDAVRSSQNDSLSLSIEDRHARFYDDDFHSLPAKAPEFCFLSDFSTFQKVADLPP